MTGIANVNIVKAPKLTEGIENLDKGLDSIAARIDNLDSSIVIQIGSNNDALTTMLDSINLTLHNVSDSISSSSWFLDNCLPNL